MWIYLIIRKFDKHVICAYVSKADAKKHLDAFPEEVESQTVSIYGDGELHFIK